ncbi:type I glyceraldehyde-3-phosphate dehydrogenase [Mesoterricola silvestris]|uniref:Glyceraldehyde-3-phosphate dehydrogenase n=1 Tax=Mesoterricola silvestris TaxID=2927979 RepID=A0AA48GY50_9BACT|nr:type I glyceraldehyde-3-phosphate dehydrogenase [Mesoterricola silvestris]BDU72508.1 glyceraldehyde-3-phosphate dehydrogenase [Mesoterricola silvestris]
MRIAINGLGRVGRQVLRRIHGVPGLELVGVNDPADAATLAHLVTYDSVHGKAPFPVEVQAGHLVLDGLPVPLSAAPDPARTPFGDLGAEVVLECSGRFTRRAEAAGHLRGSVRHVVISAPSPDADATVVPGVNASRREVLSAACPATHALSLLVGALDAAFGVEAGLATAVESYGNDQRILDLPHADPRMARAAAMSMIPAPTDMARCLGEALPWTRGRFEALAVRVPTPDVSILDLGATLRTDADLESVHAALRRAGDGAPGLVQFLEAPLVSVDLRGREASCIVDPWLTRIHAPRFVKVFAWYDNEAAYAARLRDLCLELAR